MTQARTYLGRQCFYLMSYLTKPSRVAWLKGLKCNYGNIIITECRLGCPTRRFLSVLKSWTVTWSWNKHTFTFQASMFKHLRHVFWQHCKEHVLSTPNITPASESTAEGSWSRSVARRDWISGMFLILNTYFSSIVQLEITVFTKQKASITFSSIL